MLSLAQQYAQQDPEFTAVSGTIDLLFGAGLLVGMIGLCRKIWQKASPKADKQ